MEKSDNQDLQIDNFQQILDNKNKEIVLGNLKFYLYNYTTHQLILKYKSFSLT